MLNVKMLNEKHICNILRVGNNFKGSSLLTGNSLLLINLGSYPRTSTKEKSPDRGETNA
jgi:hypothetical protein